MCGIYGAFFDYEALEELPFDPILQTTTLIRQASLRGEDSYGVLVDNGTVVRGIKCPDKSSQTFRWSDAFPTHGFGKGFNMVMGNSRAYPTVELTTMPPDKKDVQPFMSPSERWYVSHNGLISNDQYIRDTYLKGTDFEVPEDISTDSAIIPYLLDYLMRFHEYKESLETVQALLTIIEGNFAMVIYDRKFLTMHLVTNFMPMYFQQSPHFLLAGSLPDFLMESYPTEECPPYSITSFTLCSHPDTGDPFVKKMRVNLFNTGIKVANRHPYKPKKVAISFSGGMDSCVNARLYQALGYDVTLVHFSYGQAAEKVEKWVTQQLAEQWDMEDHYIDATTVFKGMPSALLTGGAPDPEMQNVDAETTLSYVPNRNMVFASLLAGVAESLDIPTAVVNMNLGDSPYPDNGYLFMKFIERCLMVSLSPNQAVQFTSPLINLEKWEIVKLGLSLFNDWDLSTSCYYPKMKGEFVEFCGQCGPCQMRRRGFLMNKMKDPADYYGEGIGLQGLDTRDLKELNSSYFINAAKPLPLGNFRNPANDILYYRRLKKYL